MCSGSFFRARTRAKKQHTTSSNVQGTPTSATLHGDDKILAIHVRPSARARMNEKYDVLLFKMKWDIAKISFGFALGFLARCLIQ